MQRSGTPRRVARGNHHYFIRDLSTENGSSGVFSMAVEEIPIDRRPLSRAEGQNEKLLEVGPQSGYEARICCFAFHSAERRERSESAGRRERTESEQRRVRQFVSRHERHHSSLLSSGGQVSHVI